LKFKDKIREFRWRLGRLTQEEFADKVGTTSVSVSKWESGTVRPLAVYKANMAQLDLELWDSLECSDE
jgi:DNA-binding transcriptional regulator YiaG